MNSQFFPFTIDHLRLTRLDAQLGNRGLVFLCVWIGKHARLENVQLPNFEVSEISEDNYVSHNSGTFPQQGVNQESSLVINSGLLTELVRSIKELAPGRIHRRQERKALFD